MAFSEMFSRILDQVFGPTSQPRYSRKHKRRMPQTALVSHMEQLESRELLTSFSADVFGDVLKVEGTNGADTIAVEENGGELVLTANNSSGTTTRLFQTSQINSIEVRGYDGNDMIDLSNVNKHTKIFGGSGNDTLTGGSGHDMLSGGTGNDTLFGGAGNDNLYGNDHDDWLYGEDGDDYLSGAHGNDYVDAGAGDDRVSGGVGDDILKGFSGADTILGEDGNDQIYGHGENDQLHGGTGNDTIDAGAGDDYVNGGLDDDILKGFSGEDTILGKSGNDQIYGHGGDDTLDGGTGSDRISGGLGFNTINGGDGPIDTLFEELDSDFTLKNDVVIFVGGQSTLSGIDRAQLTGGASNNIIDASQFSGETVLNGLGGNDLLFGGSGNDTLKGGAGDDHLYGNDDDDWLYGEDGADYLSGASGEDHLYGGAQNDTLDGGNHNDYLSGGTEDDILYGRDGADDLYGNSGHDHLYGGEGDDYLSGYTGDDRLYDDLGYNTIKAENGITISGEIADEWLELGDENGALGLPTKTHADDGLGGNFQLFNGGLIAAPRAGQIQVIYHVQNALTISTFGPNSALSKTIIQQYADEGAAELRKIIQAESEKAYEKVRDDLTYNHNWGNEITWRTPDGLNWDGSVHYREDSAQHGFWERGAVEKPQIRRMEVKYTSTDPSTNTLKFRVEASIDMKIWKEVQQWSYGAKLYSMKVDGVYQTFVSFDVELTPSASFDPNNLQISASLSASISNLKTAHVLSFGEEAPGDFIASMISIFPTLLVNSDMGQLMQQATVKQTVDYFHRFQVNARLIMGANGPYVYVEQFYNGERLDSFDFDLL